jgi:membrane protein implicated in regulation of membrane protease activity
VWQTIAILFAGFAFAAGFGALTVSGDAAIKPAVLWVLTSAFVALAATCFLAHWDVNRGRRTRQYETEELSPGSD